MINTLILMDYHCYCGAENISNSLILGWYNVAEFETEQPLGTFDDVLNETIENLRGDDNTDTALLDILVEHIVNLSPSGDAVALAETAIEELAVRRGEKH